MAVLIALLLAGVGSLVLGTAPEAKAQSITLAKLAGPWQIALAGNTGCGASSMLFSGTMNTIGIATGTLSGSSTGCPSGSSTQTFTIDSLTSHGSGMASLSCGSGCAWNFQIQVAANAQSFNLLDEQDGQNNVLAGTAVAQTSSTITIAQLAGPWQMALVGNTGCGRSSMLFTGRLDTAGAATGTLSGSSTGCPSGSSSQTFTINSLNLDGSGTATLSCGSGCGWNFHIQVAPNKQMFNLVDIGSGDPNFNELAGTAVSQAGSGINLAQLAGPWTIALVGNTGCGSSSMLFTETSLNTNNNDTPTGTLSGSSSGCPSSSSTQTFTINSLNPDGSGTASLSCGAGCGWNFHIQVAPNKQTFNLVDIGSGDPNFNELAGTAVAKPGFVSIPDVADLQPVLAEQDIQAAGLHWKLSGSGTVVAFTRPNIGTFVPVGSTVTLVLGIPR